VKLFDRQKGDVSIFIVVFTALLFVIVTVGFARIMLRGQIQATTNDLSQSAYDSAQVGVEDAKRAVIRYLTVCENNPTGTDCSSALAALESDVCNESVKTLTDVKNSEGTDEIKVQNNTSANNLNQAYTCVTVNLNTPDYLGKLGENEYKLIPLIGEGNYNTVEIEWFNSEDLGPVYSNVSLPATPATSPFDWPLYSKSSWPSNRPAMMRFQMIQYAASGFDLTYFDDNSSASGSGQSNTNTAFLYPSNKVTAGMKFDDPIHIIAVDNRRSPTKEPVPVHCENTIASGGYSCAAHLLLPPARGGSAAETYIYLGSLYNKSNYRITLRDGSGNIVNFKGVQPEVDSTGRANDLFRRVKSRLEIGMNFPYPTAGIVTSGSVCKDFKITDDEDDFDKGSCTP